MYSLYLVEDVTSQQFEQITVAGLGPACVPSLLGPISDKLELGLQRPTSNNINAYGKFSAEKNFAAKSWSQGTDMNE